jgi:hypothetical protein
VVKVLALRCPRCTARFEVEVTRARRRETCPSCGISLPPAPDAWAERPDLDDLRPKTDDTLLGAPRRNWKVTALTATVLYPFIYSFVAFDELDRQHRRRHATGLYLGGLLTLVGIAALATAPFLEPDRCTIGTCDILPSQVVIWATWGVAALTLCIGFALAYFVREFHNLRNYRRARGLRPGIGGLEFFLWLIPGALILVGPFIGMYRANRSIRELWVHIYNEKGVRIPFH